jgi:dienelactone hydrolase
MDRVPIDDQGVHGVVFVPEESRGFVVVLSGSGGGVPEGYARRLAGYGLTSFALAYFGVDGLPTSLEEVPVETIEQGITAFRSRLSIAGRVGIMGSSKGAELALLATSLLPDEIGPTVAVAPSNVSWYGLGQSGHRSSWTWRGDPVPYLPTKLTSYPTRTDVGLRIDRYYDLSRYTQDEIEAATIPVELITTPILLLSGADDHMWPSALMARLVARRLEENTKVEVTDVVYPDAGHAFLHREFFANRDVNGRPIWDFGGSAEADAAAATDAWSRIVSFLSAGS